MSSMGFYVQFTVAVLSGYVFHVACHDSRRQCFEVESNTICYFTPNVSSVDWETAWKTCRELDATLPVILNEKGQTVIGDYLSKYFPTKPVWTAGRYIGNGSEWRWSNGRNLIGTDNPSCPQNATDCPHETQAVLTKDLKYGARYTHHSVTLAFICSYPGINCKTETKKFTQWKDGCLSWIPNHRLSLNKARNECLKDGGDLATFSEDGDLQALSSVIKDENAGEYWIGLHRKWWIWNATDEKGIKYNLLTNEAGQTGRCLFINDERGIWSQDACSGNKNVICQAERILSESDASFEASAIIGIVIAVLVVAIIFVILLIVIRNRLRIAKPTPNTTKSEPATLSRKTIEQGTDDTYATIDDDDLENLNHKNNPNPCKDRYGNLSIAESKPNTKKSDPITPSQKAIVQSTDDTYATIDLDDDVENLNYQNGPNPSTSYTKVELCNDPSSVYSEPTEFGARETERSTGVYAAPYINSAVSPVSRSPVASPTDIYAEVNKPRLGKKSDELTSPPIKIGPQGDIYTLPISHN